jgi:hypothetical protein
LFEKEAAQGYQIENCSSVKGSVHCCSEMVHLTWGYWSDTRTTALAAAESYSKAGRRQALRTVQMSGQTIAVEKMSNHMTAKELLQAY